MQNKKIYGVLNFNILNFSEIIYKFFLKNLSHGKELFMSETESNSELMGKNF